LSEPSEEEAVNLKPLLLKKFVWDIFPHEADIPAVLLSLGLVPDGEEGQEVEHAASDARLSKVAPMFKAVEVLSGIMGEAMTAYLLHLLEKQGGDLASLPDEIRETMTTQNAEVIFQGSIAMIAHMIDYEVLTYTEEMRNR
jgi:hypothetical protein